MSNNKMSKDIIPEGFTLSLALVDALPAGFLLMIISLFTGRDKINGAALWKAICSIPSCIFFVLGLLGMILMTVFSVKLDSSDAHANWIEQFTNGIAQAAIFIGLLFILI